MIAALNRARITLAVLGFCLTLGGIYLDNHNLIWAAMISLSLALAFRLAGKWMIERTQRDDTLA